ncbi:MAG: MOSC domain-containing protein [Planctomycetales bacterium]
MPRLSRILIYPVKSLDPVEVESAAILSSGALEHDRRFALFDAAGGVVHAKGYPAIHGLRAKFDLDNLKVTLRRGTKSRTFHLSDDRAPLEEWLGEHFGMPIQVRENSAAGFPDDTAAPGPTIIGSATLTEVAGWYPHLTVDEMRLRFRANLEIEADEPFWEERLYREEGEAIRFRIGDVELAGTNPCARCVVPTRDPRSGVRFPEFGRIFEEKRYETLPYWATRSRFDHFYRLAVNTRPVSERGGTLRVGDKVELCEPE